MFVAALVLALRLSIGPIPMNFLKDDLEGALSPGGGAYQVRLEGVVLTWGGVVQGLGIAVTGVRVTDKEGAVVGEIPEFTMALSMVAAFSGTLAPSEISIQNPRIQLFRRDEKLEAQVGDAKADGAVLGGVFASLLEPPNARHPLGYVTEFRLIGADVTIEDPHMAVPWRLPRLDVHLYRDDEEVSGDYAVELELRGKRARFTGEVSRRYAAGKIRLGVDFHEVEPAMFANVAGSPEQIAGLKIPVNGTIALAVLEDGTLEEANFALTSGEGQVTIPGVYDKTVDITHAALRGMVGAGLSRFSIEEFSVNLGGPTIKATVREERAENKLVLNGDVEIRDVPVNKLPQYWPRDASPNTRSWVEESLSYGGISQTNAAFSVAVDLAAEPSIVITSIEGTMQYHDLDVKFADEFPLVTGVDGTATFNAGNVDFTVTDGTYETLAITSGTINIYGLEAIDQFARIDLNVESPVRPALEALDHPKLRYLQKMDLSADRFDGKAAIRLLVNLPLLNDLRLDDLKVGAEAGLREASFKDALPGVDLAKGELQMKLDGSLLSVKGQAELAGVSAEVSWEENFAEKADFDSRYTLKGRMNAAQRAAFGFDTDPFLSGPADVSLLYTSRNGDGTLTVDLDLADTGIHMPGFEWSKPTGAPARGNVRVDLKQGKVRRIRKLAVAADGMDVSGAVQFAADGKTVEWVRFERLKFGVTDVEGKATRGPEGRFDVNLVGRGLNAEKLLFGGESEMKLPPIKLTLAIDHVRLGSKPTERIDRLVGSMAYDGKRWAAILLDGDFEKRGTMQLVVKPEGKTRTLILTSNAGGAVLESMSLMPNLHGGELVVSGVFHDDEEPDIPLRGRMKMKNFRAVNAPVLAKLLSVASLTGALDLLRGKGVEFTRLDVPFTITESEITLEQGRAFGSAIGITFEGKVDNVKKTLNVRGTIIPAYTINQALGKIPLIGEILVGGKGEGVFAVNYKINGPRDDPGVSVNPLSALTPGFLRMFFDVFEDIPANPVETSPPASPNRYLLPTRIRAWRFLPALSLMTPSESRSAAVIRLVSLAGAASLTRAPPPRMRRRASALLTARPARWKSTKAGIPASSSARESSMLGSPSAAAPVSKVACAVSAAAAASFFPWQSAVASFARTFFASFISLPSSFSRRAISSRGRSVKRRKNFPTSASSVLRQYCQ
ncbi:MAG: AsmA-like C-terminal domain-containing protein [Alphaproteobacteria bacterium]|nr:AsmA-like C-terminal domain-containing protein [Alphaproteobacteria bacterium]